VVSGQADDEFKIEDGYTSRFNGKNLTRWRYPGAKGRDMDDQTETLDKRIAIEKGVIVMNEKDRKGKGGIRDLYTSKRFNKDFYLKLGCVRQSKFQQ